jgi:anti-sigma factor (TIGR02949 family)
MVVRCELTGTHLHAYLDGELDAAGAASFERHLQSCQLCAAELSSERALRQTLAGAQLYERAPEQLRKNVLSKLPADSPARTKALPFWRLAALAAALLLAAFLGRELLSVFRGPSDSDLLSAAAIDAHLRSLQPGHLTDVQSTDQHTVKPWFDGKVDFAPAVQDFSGEGFPLLGGRLDVLAGRTAGALVYGRRKHIINVFVLQNVPAGGMRDSAERSGYHTLSWKKGGLNYVAVSDVADADLQELRDLFLKE